MKVVEQTERYHIHQVAGIVDTDGKQCKGTMSYSNISKQSWFIYLGFHRQVLLKFLYARSILIQIISKFRKKKHVEKLQFSWLHFPVLVTIIKNFSLWLCKCLEKCGLFITSNKHMLPPLQLCKHQFFISPFF